MDKPVYAYYVGATSSTGSLTFRHHSNCVADDEKSFFKTQKSSGFEGGSGIQTLKTFKKCIVSVLGEITEADFEPRKDVRLKTTKKRS